MIYILAEQLRFAMNIRIAGQVGLNFEAVICHPLYLVRFLI